MGSTRQLLLFSRRGNKVGTRRAQPATIQKRAGGKEVGAHIRQGHLLLPKHAVRPLKSSSGRIAGPKPSQIDPHSLPLHRLLPKARRPPPETRQKPASRVDRPRSSHPALGSACTERPQSRASSPAGPPCRRMPPDCPRPGLLPARLLQTPPPERESGRGRGDGSRSCPGSVRLRSRGEASQKTSSLAFPRRLRFSLKKIVYLRMCQRWLEAGVAASGLASETTASRYISWVR